MQADREPPPASRVDLDAQVRRVDLERWLSSRFVADSRTRADLIALYAFEAELEAIPRRVSQPLLAEMRLAWWAEQMDGVFAGAPRKGHPVLEALARPVAGCGLDRAALDGVIEARIRAAHGEAEDVAALYVAPMAVAARLLGGGAAADVEPAGRAWAAAKAGDIQTARALRRPANRALTDLPTGAFPAVAHATLVRRDEAEAVKRLRLVWAVARGRI